jgi:hypothetical protein
MKKQQNKKRVLIVANDAGGANILAAWARKNKNKKILVSLSGPAKSIFEKSGLKFKDVSLGEYFKKLKKPGDFIFTGTSFPPSIEQQAINSAHKNKIKCVSFLDHWTNYRKRFISARNQEILPNEIWVGDKVAYKIALQQGFSKKILKQVENPYLREITEYFKGKKHVKKINEKIILFISAPVGSFKNENPHLLTEFDQLEMLIRACLDKGALIKIRLHPRENPDKFNELIARYKDAIKIGISKRADLKDDIIEADFVVGAESMALVVAVLARKKVLSILPIKTNKISLPFKKIIKVHSEAELKKQIYG